MTLNSEIVQKLKAQIADAKVHIELEQNLVKLVVVSDVFQGLSLVKKQQLVYAALSDLIAAGTLHAVNMETFTSAEWEKTAPFRQALVFE